MPKRVAQGRRSCRSGRFLRGCGGEQTVLVALRPEVAQTIAGLGLDLSDSSRVDPQSAVEYAMRQRRSNQAA
jgi:hypothetical protein